MHAPYNKLVQKGFARLAFMDLRRGTDSDAAAAAAAVDAGLADKHAAVLAASRAKPLEETYADRDLEMAARALAAPAYARVVAPSERLSQEVGNCYTASLYMNLLSLLNTEGSALAGKRILAYSYGSGYQATMFFFRGGSPERLDALRATVDLSARLAAREQVTPEVFDATLDLREQALGKADFVPAAPLDGPTGIRPGAYYLAAVEGKYQRRYERMAPTAGDAAGEAAGGAKKLALPGAGLPREEGDQGEAKVDGGSSSSSVGGTSSTACAADVPSSTGTTTTTTSSSNTSLSASASASAPSPVDGLAAEIFVTGVSAGLPCEDAGVDDEAELADPHAASPVSNPQSVSRPGSRSPSLDDGHGHGRGLRIVTTSEKEDDVALLVGQSVARDAGRPQPSHKLFEGSIGLARLLAGDNMIQQIGPRKEAQLLRMNIVQMLKPPNSPVGGRKPIASKFAAARRLSEAKAAASSASGDLIKTIVSDRSQLIKIAGRLPTFDLTDPDLGLGISAKVAATMDRTAQLAVAAGVEALRDAALLPMAGVEAEVALRRHGSVGCANNGPTQLHESLRDSTGVVFASSFPGLATMAEETDRMVQGTQMPAGAPGSYEFNRKILFGLLVPGNAQLAQLIGARGPNTMINAACAGATQAVGIAQDWIRAGRCDRVVVVSSDDASGEALFPWIGGGFQALSAASTAATVEEGALPFDQRRNGMILGAGATAMVLESARGVEESNKVRREILGFATQAAAETEDELRHSLQILVEGADLAAAAATDVGGNMSEDRIESRMASLALGHEIGKVRRRRMLDRMRLAAHGGVGAGAANGEDDDDDDGWEWHDWGRGRGRKRKGETATATPPSADAAVVPAHKDHAVKQQCRYARLVDTSFVNSGFHGSRLDRVHLAEQLVAFLDSVEARHGITRQMIVEAGAYMSHETFTNASPTSSCASVEVHALRAAFGDLTGDLLLCNTKGFTGHPMGVSFEDVCAIEMLLSGIAPPTANHKIHDNALGAPLNLSRGGYGGRGVDDDEVMGRAQAREGGRADISYVLRMAAGFGSHIAFSLYAR